MPNCTDYEGRLPYCWAWDAKTRTEYLLNRGYGAVAMRPADEPLASVYLTGEVYPDYDYRGWFYTDPRGARHDKKHEARCERILARFLAGYDVRGYLLDDDVAGQGNRAKPPKTGARYREKTPHNLPSDPDIEHRLKRIEEAAMLADAFERHG